MDTISTNTQSQANYDAAADVILAILNDFNFYTDTKFDPKELKQRIALAIQKTIEGNTNYARPTG